MGRSHVKHRAPCADTLLGGPGFPLPLNGVDRDNLSAFRFSTPVNTRFYRFQHIGSAVAHAALRAYSRRDILNDDALALHLAVKGHALFHNPPAAVFTCLAFPEPMLSCFRLN